MNERKYNNKLQKLKEASSRLNDLIESKEKTSYFEDAVIQRFEFTFELLWKTLKEVLEENLIQVNNTPREVFKAAFSAGYIQNEEIADLMLYDRNLTTHMYSQDIAHQIFKNIIEKYIDQINKIILKIEEI